MKFRAKIQGIYLSNLKDVFSALEKVNTFCFITLSSEKTSIICTGNGETPSCYVEIENSSIFFEYRIESLSNSEIFLKLTNKNMLKGLSDTQNALNGVIKLSKKNNLPSLEISLEKMRNIVNIVHDVPIELVEYSEIQCYAEPEISVPDLKIEFPHYDTMKRVTSNMKPIHKLLKISASTRGELILESISDIIQVRTIFNDLKVLTNNIEPSEQFSCSVNVLATQFLKLTFYCLLKPLDVICCKSFSSDSLTIYCIVLRGGITATYYLPLIDFQHNNL